MTKLENNILRSVATEKVKELNEITGEYQERASYLAKALSDVISSISTFEAIMEIGKE